MSNSELLGEANRFTKIYESGSDGNMHFFHIEDYLELLKWLHTHPEIDSAFHFINTIFY